MIANLINETVDGIVVIDPIIVTMKYILRDGQHLEQAVTSKFCQFGEDNLFTFSGRNLIYWKKLDPDMIPYYRRIVKALAAADLANTLPDNPEELEELPKDRIIH